MADLQKVWNKSNLWDKVKAEHKKVQNNLEIENKGDEIDYN